MNRRTRTAVSVIWALMPLITLGIATTLVFAVAAIRLRKPIHWAAVIGYLALTTLNFSVLDSPDGSAGDALFGAVLIVLWLGGTAHAFAIRSRVFAPSVRATPAYEGAVATALDRRALREAARETARDPVLAWELRIGRPDLPRGFDDGGLIDVNHVPPRELASLPGMTPVLVDQIVRARAQCDGFASVEELSVLADLPPTLTETLGEYTVFLP